MRGPLLHAPQTTERLMRWTILATVPGVCAACWRFGVAAAVLFGSAGLGALLADWLWTRARTRAPGDDSATRLGSGKPPTGQSPEFTRASLHAAVITGVSMAMMLPAQAPPWLAALGGVLAITLGKHLFGGLGQNPFNPSALARVLLMAWIPAPFFPIAAALDGATAASPLAQSGGTGPGSAWELLMGHPLGSLAEGCPLAILAGGGLLLATRIIDWRIPLGCFAGVALTALVVPPGERVLGHAPWLAAAPITHLLAGGTPLAAFFLLTDPVTRPFTPGGRIAFGLLAGAASMAIRFHSPYPDGTALAVVLANATVPWIDRWTVRRGR